MVHSKKLTVALIQTDLVWEDINANLTRISTKIESISSNVDIIILPEMFTTGFTMKAHEFAETMDGKSVRWMQQLATKKQAAIVGSSIISEESFDSAQGKRFYNRLLFVHPSGKIDFYDKRHTFRLAKEHEVFSAGNQKLIVDFKGWKICPLVCYDLRFPVWARNTEDYDLLLYIASWPKARISAWDVLLEARAIENMSYTLGVNRVGIDGNKFEYVGHSIGYDFLGKPLSEKQFEKEDIIVLELDKIAQNNMRTKLGFLQDRDSFSFL